MPRLSNRDGELLKQDLKAGVSDKIICQKYNITQRAVRTRRSEVRDEDQGLPPKSKIQKVKEVTEEIEPISIDEDEELPPLIESEPIALELELEKDYCADCYEKGLLTEVNKDMVKCPKCEVVLNWER